MQQGIETTVLDDLSTGARSNAPDGVEFIQFDIASPAVIDAIAGRRPDIVVHAAAQISVPMSVMDPARDRAVNLIGTEHVIRGARAGDAGRIVFLSSGGAIFGEASGATEDSLPAPLSPYWVHKLAAESYVRLSGLPYGVVRLSNVCGPRQRHDLEGGVVSIFLEACRADGRVTIFGDGLQTRDFLHVADAVDGTLAVATAEVSGTWNVATGCSTTILELLREVEDLAGRPAEVSMLPPRAGDVRVSTLDVRRIRKDLGWRPRRSLRRGLEVTLRAAT